MILNNISITLKKITNKYRIPLTNNNFIMSIQLQSIACMIALLPFLSLSKVK